MLLKARTIRSGVDLGPARIAVQRPDPFRGPTKLYMAYIEDGYAKVATSLMVDRIPTQWDYEYSLVTAIDVAIEFDGAWKKKVSSSTFDFYTIGSPWVVMVRPTGKLIIQKGQLDTPYELDSDVTRVAMIRGWRNIVRWEWDQGLVVFYIKNGEVYYRNYAVQAKDDPPTWGAATKVAGLPSPVDNIAAFRTNDYRVGILCEYSGSIYMALTERNWSGMAIRDHTVTARAEDLLIDFIPISYIDGFTTHTISAVGSIETLEMLYGASYNAFSVAENEENETVHAWVLHDITDITKDDFEIVDEDNTVFRVLELQIDELDSKHLIMTTDNLNLANQSGMGEGDLTLKFLGGGAGEAGQAFDPFEITFTPEGLEFEGAGAPEVEEMWNE